MKKKGFTLVELLAVIIILGLILTIAVPNVIRIIVGARQDSYEAQKELIINAARNYATSSKELIWIDNATVVYLKDLQDANMIDNPLKDPRGGEFDNRKPEGVKVILTKRNKIITYEIIVPDPNAPPMPADNTGASAPKLATGMIPVMYDGTNWVKADVNNLEGDYEWYDYDEKIWANAVTVTTTNRATHLAADAGTVIPMTDINTMWVWIPRYKYRIPAGTGSREIDIVFESKETTKSTGDAVTTYYTHPAFTFDGDELGGLWIGKFETSGTVSALTIKPNLSSLRTLKVKNIYDSIKNSMQGRPAYGFTGNSDVHLMKNTEWGAMAYLSHSKYGKTGEIYKNNNSLYITGCSGENVSSPASSECPYPYDNIIGMNASTTGNIYGIYDTSGGAYEYVMGVYMPNPIPVTGINDASGFSNTSTNSRYEMLVPINSKYYNRYLSTQIATGAILGDATIETAGWYGDSSNFISTTAPWFVRGNANNATDSAGIMAFGYCPGDAYDHISFRIALTNNLD